MRKTLMLILLLLMLSACATPTVGPTPTPTRTPKPTLTATPIPTPTPAFPVTVGCAAFVPDEVCGALQALALADVAHFLWIDDAAQADIVLGGSEVPDVAVQGSWLYAVAAPFFTLEDEVASADLLSTWQGTPAGPFAERALLVSADTRDALSALLGEPGAGVQVVAPEALLSLTEEMGAWAILPFHELRPEWKVMRVDGLLPIAKKPLEGYPLQVDFYLGSGTRPETLALLPLETLPLTNRDEARMTLVAMTGVTAITRGTARLIERTSVTYPAQDVKPWFEDADLVHVSNEVSFKPDCPAATSGSMSFCSDDRYIGLLEEIGTNVVELTGNHLGDKGYQWITHSLEMYQERGWDWYGGGADFADATRPLTITHNGNRIAFIGCNPSGAGVFASEETPGAAPCFESWQMDLMLEQVRTLRDQGYLPIVTLQHKETDQYFPPHEHMRDLRAFAEAGAVVAHGSQAHWVKTMEFHGETFIHYGPGNFFFDQMWDDAVRQEFVTRYTFYDGQLLSIELRTALLEEYGRPRPMTPEERREFLQMIFDLRPQEE